MLERILDFQWDQHKMRKDEEYVLSLSLLSESPRSAGTLPSPAPLFRSHRFKQGKVFS